MVRLSDQGFATPYGDDPAGIRGLAGSLNFDGQQMEDWCASANQRPPDSHDRYRPDTSNGVHIQTTTAVGVRGGREPLRHDPHADDAGTTASSATTQTGQLRSDHRKAPFTRRSPADTACIPLP